MASPLIYTENTLQVPAFTVGAEFEDCEFHGVDFRKFNLKSVSFFGCVFSSCNLANQAVVNASFREVRFEGCNAVGINWCAAKRLELVRFQDCKLTLSSFQEMKLRNLEMTNCSAVDVDFSDADLTCANFSETNLAGANLNGAILDGCDFRTSRDYLFDLRKAKIKGAKFSFPYVISLLTALGAEVEF